jgi:hypothetical protein
MRTRQHLARLIGHFELSASLARRKIAQGRLSKNIHKAFYRLPQIAPSSLSGNKLILTILLSL